MLLMSVRSAGLRHRIGLAVVAGTVKLRQRAGRYRFHIVRWYAAGAVLNVPRDPDECFSRAVASEGPRLRP